MKRNLPFFFKSLKLPSVKLLRLCMFSFLCCTVFYSLFNSRHSRLFLKSFIFIPLLSGSSCSHLPSLYSTISPHSVFTSFLSLYPFFLPSGSLGWCDAGCESQGYKCWRVGGGGPGVWALWQRQQVLQLPTACFYPEIHPPRYFPLSPKIYLWISSSSQSLFTASHKLMFPLLTENVLGWWYIWAITFLFTV